MTSIPTKDKQYKEYRCRNPYRLSDCRKNSTAEVGSEREINQLCPECQEYKENQPHKHELNPK